MLVPIPHLVKDVKRVNGEIRPHRLQSIYDCDSAAIYASEHGTALCEVSRCISVNIRNYGEPSLSVRSLAPSPSNGELVDSMFQRRTQLMDPFANDNSERIIKV